MTTLSTGALCTVRQFGTRLFVAKEPLPDNRWRLTCLQVDSRGRAAYQTRDAGVGDITTIRDAKAYQFGSTVRYEGLDHLVFEDRCNSIEVGVPEHTSPTKSGEPVNLER